jgi:uncharacterized protein (TIGR00288 family)
MNNHFGRSTPQQGGAVQAGRTARSAALLIDFDNVTLGVHSDLGRELKALINSEVFRGKIAVRRAYADWRRYPSYVVPLTEASIDLIFAPAYGSSKKNTTDLRMSADAIELAFTRPEIDTFILLTGDSDFSSTVMKLKEYGKYVIGVGMRESSSDLIIQNCDEYFSYHALTGLTRTRVGEGDREDPWELVVRAAQKMVAGGDAMRTDRLKQVMLSLDPGFNEKEIGYPKFSRFVAEAERKGLLKLRKLPDGQYEIAIDGVRAPAPSPAGAAVPAAPREERERRDRRDRGRRREAPGTEMAAVAAAGRPSVPEAAPAAPPTEPSPEPVEAAAPLAAPAAAASDLAQPMAHALTLLQRAVRALRPRAGESVRDGDVKRKMLEVDPGFDEAKLGFSKFSRFLRQAHEFAAVDVERVDGGQYEVKLGSRTFEAPPLVEAPAPRTAGAAGYPSVEAAPPAAAAAAEERVPAVSLRGRLRSRAATPPAGPPPILPGQVVRPATEPQAPPVEPVEPPVAAEPEPAEAAPEPPRRRDRRGRRAVAAEAVPPPLPGQVVEVPTEAGAEPVEALAEQLEADAAAPAEPTPRKRRRGGRGRKRQPEAEEPPAAEPPAFSAEALGLPTGRKEIENYLSRSYKGVGKKTAEPLLDAFGAEVFRIFAQEPERVRELLGERRAATVLEQWETDYQRRQQERGAEAGETAAAVSLEEAAPEGAALAEAPAAEVATPEPPRRRRGGRGRQAKPERQRAAEPAREEVVEAEAAPAPAPRARRRGGRGRQAKPAEHADAEAGPEAKQQPPEEAAPSAAHVKRARAANVAPAEAEPAPAPAEQSAEAEPQKQERRTRSRGGRGRGQRKKGEPAKA